MLVGFQGTFSEGCEFVNIDIAGQGGGCTPNQAIDLSDILAVLDAFQGMSSCCAEDAARPTRPRRRSPRFGRNARMTLVASRMGSRVDGLVEVDVFLEGVSDVRGYQIGVSAFDGHRRGIAPVDAFVNTSRADYVLAGVESITASDAPGGRLAGATFDGGLSTAGGAYLGTFVFRTSSNTIPRLRFKIRPSATMVIDSQLHPVHLSDAPAVLRMPQPSKREIPHRR